MSVVEFEAPFDGGQVEYVEHSRSSRAKKVVTGPLMPVQDAGGNYTYDVIDLTANSKANTLPADMAFRCISDADWYFKQAGKDETLVTGDADIYVPGKMAIVISSREFPIIAVSGAGSFIQAVPIK